MFSVRQFAAAAVVGVALAAGGCASDQDHGIPNNATLSAQGMGPVTFTAPSSGTAYVYDSGDDYIVWSGPVRRGQTISVDTSDNRIMVDNRIASDKSVIGGHRHKIYFDTSDNARLAADRDVVVRDRDGNIIVNKDADVTIKRDRPNVTVEQHSPDVTVKTDRGQDVTIHRESSTDSGDTTVRKQTTVRPDGTVTQEQRVTEHP